jgi:dynein heavy chain
MYLEPIFSSDDIYKQLPEEGDWFKWIDNLWTETMKAVNDEPAILELCEREHISLNFIKANKDLDKI